MILTLFMRFKANVQRLLHNRRLRWSLLAFILSSLVFLAWAHAHVPAQAGDRVYAHVQDVPAREVGLVLGANPHLPDGRRNIFFDYRMDTAAELWRAGKVRLLLVSGDNGADNYDEVTAMRDALVSRGVPIENIVRDHAGFRTLDSVVRCLNVFGVRRPIIVSQRWHAERALYIADHRGLDAIAVAAQDLKATSSPRSHIREYFARARAVLDVNVFRAKPRFPGPPEPIPGLADSVTTTAGL